MFSVFFKTHVSALTIVIRAPKFRCSYGYASTQQATACSQSLKQAFTNCMHNYDCASNMHANDVTYAQTFVQGID